MKRQGLYLIVLISISAGLSAAAQQEQENNTGNTGPDTEYREKYYPTGNLMYQGNFRNDLPIGEMKRYSENGNLQAILDYDEDGRSVRAVLFYEDGTKAAEGLYLNMQKDSIWRYYSYYDSQLAAEETYRQGRLNGPVRTYYSNGQVSEIVEWMDDERNGLWEQYFENGDPRLRAHYTGDQLEGEYRVFFENGNPSVIGNYLNGQRHGLWTLYGEDGAAFAELNYEHGRNLDPDVTDSIQDDLFRRIDENRGMYDEPDETEFLMPSAR